MTDCRVAFDVRTPLTLAGADRVMRAKVSSDCTVIRALINPRRTADKFSTRAMVLEVLGHPDGEKAEFVEYYHSLGIGTARVWLVDDRITKLCRI